MQTVTAGTGFMPPRRRWTAMLGHQQQRPVSNSIACRVSKPSSNWRWFGFDTETTGLDIFEDQVIQLAAYDLESGNSYTTLINPALHKPNYVFGSEAYRMHGIPKALLDAEGVSLMDAFDGLVTFVNSQTQPGQTPALVSHAGFKFHFRIIEQNLQQAAMAATKAALAGPTPASGSSSRTRRGRIQQQRQQQQQEQQLDIADGNSGSNASSSSRLSNSNKGGFVELPAASGEGHEAGRAYHDRWPSSWMFHDSAVMARCLQLMQPPGSALRQKLSDTTRKHLAAALLPAPYSEADVQPRERAFADAASVARLTGVLLGLLQPPPELPADTASNNNGQQQQQLQQWDGGSLYPQLQQRHAPWLSRPWPLQATKPQGPSVRGFGTSGPLSMCPPDMIQAAFAAAGVDSMRSSRSRGSMFIGSLSGMHVHDPVIDALRSHYNYYATRLH